MGAVGYFAHSEEDGDSSLRSSFLISCSLTVWRKSLLFHGNGYAVFDDSDGSLIFRVDNYSYKWREKTFLMDGYGHVLITIIRRRKIKWGIGESWEAYRGEMEMGSQETPLLTATKARGIPRCSVLVGKGDADAPATSFSMHWCTNQECLKIYNTTSSSSRSQLVAEIRRKSGPTPGTLYSKDVMALRVVLDTDVTIVMAMVMINDAMR